MVTFAAGLEVVHRVVPSNQPLLLRLPEPCCHSGSARVCWFCKTRRFRCAMSDITTLQKMRLVICRTMTEIS